MSNNVGAWFEVRFEGGGSMNITAPSERLAKERARKRVGLPVCSVRPINNLVEKKR